MKALLAAFGSGLLFALGLGLSGMTRPDIVQGFLDPLGSWNPSLVAVMVGAIFVFSLSFRLIVKRKTPFWDEKFYLPTKKEIDWRLVSGAALFGLGWGWTGICPGPGLVSLVSGESSFFIFVISMLVGMKAFMWIEKNWLR